MSANKVIRDPLWATLVGALIAAMGVCFFGFVQSGEAAPQASDEQHPYASITPWIVGGTEVPNGKYPFMAFLNFTVKGQSVGFCGGTLIDQDSVLTARHCFYAPNTGKPIPKSVEVQVIVGRTVRSSNQGQVRSAKRVHQAFKSVSRPTNARYDAAVVELSRPVWGITPIKLATSKQNYLEKPGRNATVAGWGNTIAHPPRGFRPQPPGPPEIPDRMHEAQVPIVSDSSAEGAYDPRPETRLTRPISYSPLLMIAAGGKVKDACQGDSGGPLFVARAPDGGSSGPYTQIGITSLNTGGCAYKDFPMVYTEVNNPSVRSFITNAAGK
jgi:secreted trypsin-like serine protease